MQDRGAAMILNVTVEDKTFPLDVPPEILEQGTGFFDKMDSDMDQGWQMSREYVNNPNRLERCQIAADRILTALHAENTQLMLLMAGYILSRMPGVSGVIIDTTGEMQNTEVVINK
jgi:hypothetical protein